MLCIFSAYSMDGNIVMQVFRVKTQDRRSEASYTYLGQAGVKSDG